MTLVALCWAVLMIKRPAWAYKQKHRLLSSRSRLTKLAVRQRRPTIQMFSWRASCIMLPELLLTLMLLWQLLLLQ